MMVMQCKTANVAWIMTLGFTGEDWRFSWRMLSTWLLTAALCQHRQRQDASHYWGSTRSSTLKEINSVERKIVRWNRRLDWNASLLQTNLISTVLNTKFEKPCFSVLICWKFEYKQCLLPNDLKWIQLYSSHSVACPTLHLVGGQTQLQLWLYTPKYNLCQWIQWRFEFSANEFNG